MLQIEESQSANNTGALNQSRGDLQAVAIHTFFVIYPVIASPFFLFLFLGKGCPEKCIKIIVCSFPTATVRIKRQNADDTLSNVKWTCRSYEMCARPITIELSLGDVCIRESYILFTRVIDKETAL